MTNPPRANRTHPQPQWIKARRSDNAYACVEVMIRDAYYIRDSKHAPHGPVLKLDDAQWTQLCEVLLNASHDEGPRPHSAVTIGSIYATIHSDGHLDLHGHIPIQPHLPADLRFTPIEHECFLDGLRNGEFKTLNLSRA